MQNRAQVEAKLRQETRDQIFNRQLADVISEKQAERQRNESVPDGDSMDWTKYTVERPTWG